MTSSVAPKSLAALVLRRARSCALLVAVLRVCYLVWFGLRRRPWGAPKTKSGWLAGLLGTLPDVWKAVQRHELHTWLHSLHKKHGKTFIPAVPLWVARSVVITSDAKNVEHILKTNFDNYPKGPEMRWNFGDLLGRGIFNADGQDWYHQRKSTSHMFTAKLFKDHIWIIVRRNACKLRDILTATQPGKAVDVFNLMNRFTLDTIGEIGFGKSIGSLEDPSSPFLKSFDKAQQIVMRRFVDPFWYVARFFGFGMEGETRQHFKLLDEYSRSVVRELQAGLSKDTKGVAWMDLEAKKSFVGLFIADLQKRGEAFDETFLRDLVLNFLIAGRDTTAQALSWAIFCLSIHPEIQQKAREEVLAVHGTDGPEYDDVKRLPYLQAVLSETLRLYPSVPIDVKYSLSDETLPDGTHVPAGTSVFYNIFSMGRDTTLWGDDASEFKPERWLAMEEPVSNFVYPVFNAGPRECLGRRLAYVEMTTCLAALLPCLSFKLAVPSEEIKPDAQLTLGMATGLPCEVIALKVDSFDEKSATSTTEVATCESEISDAELESASP
eukprot:TRINITY_DN32166_c0_g1_i1.p1 TRINITY_DN32166_c0_g1~~TRINITY_DN32166_c0_g1_i1.p1  ORF type:complete len:550 (-),score=94.88 TRINITY_DN32166_c0_g1_i1:91-1740(-)